MRVLPILLVTLSLLAGCRSLSEKALENMTANQRADYRDALEDLTTEYDRSYDRKGERLTDD